MSSLFVSVGMSLPTISRTDELTHIRMTANNHSETSADVQNTYHL